MLLVYYCYRASNITGLYLPLVCAWQEGESLILTQCSKCFLRVNANKYGLRSFCFWFGLDFRTLRLFLSFH